MLAVLDFLFAQSAPSDARPRSAPPERPGGPVLMGDLTASCAGRPLFLDHWRDKDEAPTGR
jgi:hypothetical protein